MPLRYKFALSIFALGALSLALLLGDRMLAGRAALTHKDSGRAEVLSEVLAHSLTPDLLAGDAKLARFRAEEFLELPRVERIEVVRPTGEPIVDVRRSDARDIPTSAVYSIARPASLRGTRVGITLARADLSESLAALLYRGIAGALLGLLLLAAASWYLGRVLGRRLEALVSNVERLGYSERPRRLPRGGSQDEIGRLSAAFRRLNTRLEDERGRRRRIEKAREEFMGMLVHDMKSPLTIIQTATSSVLTDDSVPQVYREKLLAPALRSCRKLERMITDILHLSRLQAADVPFSPRQLDVASFIKKTGAECRPLALSAGKNWFLDIAPMVVGRRIRGDESMLGRVLENLIMNAIEHTPEGGDVTLGCRSVSGGIEIFVRDTGPGVPAHQREALFRKFESTAAEAANVGLGLAFCKLAAERHKGEIGVRPAQPTGAEFYVRLPARGAEPVASMQRQGLSGPR